MEIITSSTIDGQYYQFTDLVLSMIRLRPRLMLPEHIQRFRQQMEELRNGTAEGLEDYQFIFRIFIILAHRDTPPTMGELSTELNIPFSTATRIVDWLVNGDFVERLPDPDDRRVIRVRITQAGQQYYKVSISYIQQHIQQLLSDFTAQEQAELLRLLNKLLVAFNREKSL
jgi:DNA-binding MarR family transcriptional regulator